VRDKKVKGKVNPIHTMKACKGELHLFLTLALVGDEWLGSHFCRFTLAKEPLISVE